MKTYIALLRGINVSGKKKIIMAELRAHLAQADLQKIRTYIQSGNIVFEATKSTKTLESIIKNTILKEYGFDVPVSILAQKSLSKITSANPFLKADSKIDIKQLYVAFLAQKPTPERMEVLKEKYTGEDAFILTGQVLYLRYLHGYGHSKLTNNFIERHLDVSATTRNWKTVLKLGGF